MPWQIVPRCCGVTVGLSGNCLCSSALRLVRVIAGLPPRISRIRSFISSSTLIRVAPPLRPSTIASGSDCLIARATIPLAVDLLMLSWSAKNYSLRGLDVHGRVFVCPWRRFWRVSSCLCAQEVLFLIIFILSYCFFYFACITSLTDKKPMIIPLLRLPVQCDDRVVNGSSSCLKVSSKQYFFMLFRKDKDSRV